MDAIGEAADIRTSGGLMLHCLFLFNPERFSYGFFRLPLSELRVAEMKQGLRIID